MFRLAVTSLAFVCVFSAAGQTPQEKTDFKTGRVVMDLDSVVHGRRVGQVSPGPVIKPLNRMKTDRGRIVLDGEREHVFDINSKINEIEIVVADPSADSVYEISGWQGDVKIGQQRYPVAAIDSVNPPSTRSVTMTLRTSTAFNRVKLKEIDGSTSGDPEYLLEMSVPDPAVSNIASAASGGGLSENGKALACQIPLGIAYTTAFWAGLIPLDPISSRAIDAIAAGSNLLLKTCNTWFEAPPDVFLRQPPFTCSVSEVVENVRGVYVNVLGVPGGYLDASALAFPSDWGFLGRPEIYHHNTEVEVQLSYGNPFGPSAASFGAEALLSSRSVDASDAIWGQCRKDGTVRYSRLEVDGEFVGKEYECPYVRQRRLEFPIGVNTVRWRASPRIGLVDLLDVLIVPLNVPLVPPGAKLQPFWGVLQDIGKELLKTFVGVNLSGWRMGNYRDVLQTVTVMDETPPTVDPEPFDQGQITAELVGDVIHVEIQADEAGGVSRSRYQDLLQKMYAISDFCDRPTQVRATYPTEALKTFWPVSTLESDNSFVMEWSVEDPGPNFFGLPNVVTTTMRVEVVDIQPPAIVAPPDIVEVGVGEVNDLGQPLVFDFVDLDPQISNDAVLPLGLGVHEVTWTATDASGNQATATQLVNIKNSNVAPSALAQIGANRQSAVSFEPQTIRLNGDDPDNDPLNFYIEQGPQNGFFVAPLYPYFVEDYRLEQSASTEELTAACVGDFGAGTGPDFDLDFPSQPTYIAVNDAGITFVVDRGRINCEPLRNEKFEREQRIATFAPGGGLMDSTQIGDDTVRDVIVDQRKELIYATRTSGSGDSSVRVFDFSLAPVESYGLDNLRNRATNQCGNANGPCEIKDARSAVVDDAGLLYVMDLRGLIYAVERGPGNEVKYVGMVEDVFTSGSFSGPDSLALDSQQRLYASRNNRIYRYSRSVAGNDSLFYPGSLEGWMGRCDTDLAPGDDAVCDITNRRSLGYSCTDEICETNDAATVIEKEFCGWTFSNKGDFGCRPGQFRGPRGIDIDLNDNLYVADSGNERIQRFTKDGFFAGEAESSCDGSCFVLGDFGNPQDVSVNSDRFYILDPVTNLLHSSVTSPFTDMGEDWAELVYQSNNDFACQFADDCVDSFSFSVSDGVRDPDSMQSVRSAPVSVEVAVSRNFRPPFATPGIARMLDEDTTGAILLDGSDPDPLDMLDFEIAEMPEHGEVSINGDTAEYIPDLNFVGEDRFSFSASDGLETSAPEYVELVVINVNDPPAVDEIESLQAGRGFSMPLRAGFFDPDSDEVHTVEVNWGDGVIESEGKIDGMEMITGPLLMDDGQGVGQLIADHIYMNDGQFTVEVCISDQVDVDEDDNKLLTGSSLTDCRTTSVEVSTKLDLSVLGSSGPQILNPGGTITYTAELTNVMPDAGPGMAATGVVVEWVLDPGLDPATAEVTAPAVCAMDGRNISCPVGSIAVGESETIEVSVDLKPDVEAGRLLVTRAEAVVNESDLSPQNDMKLVNYVLPMADFHVDPKAGGFADKGDVNPGDGLCESEDGVCTLRAAIQENNAGAGGLVVALERGVYELTLQFVTKDLTIIGLGADQTTINLNEESLRSLTGVSMHLESLTITNGRSAISSSGDLVVRKVRFTDNHAPGFFGAAIFADEGTVDVSDSTFDANTCQNDGIIFAFSDLQSTRFENVTFFGNEGGAVTLLTGQHELTNVTIVGNKGGSGWLDLSGSLNVYDNASATIANSVLANNYDNGGPENCLVGGSPGGTLTSLGNNVFGNLDGCDIQLADSDQQVEGPLVRRAADTGGGLPTLVPLFGSPLLDAANESLCPQADARGVLREEDGDENGTVACDIGAVELKRNSGFFNGFEP